MMFEIFLLTALICMDAFRIMGTIYCVFGLIKNKNTYKNHCIISRAILRYHTYLIDNGCLSNFPVNYSDMEKYDKTLIRFWDWGYTRILPPEKFELIKPYIVEK